MKKWLIIGTDTDVGKTCFSAAFCAGLASSKESVAYLKPIQCGILPHRDVETVQAWTSPKIKVFPSFWEFAEPVSPDQAARRSGQPHAITIEKLDLYLSNLCQTSVDVDHLIVETAGGLLTPLNAKGETWAEWLSCQDWRVILVARSGLGTLNQTSLVLNYLQHHARKVHTVVLSGELHQDNLDSLKRLFPQHHFVQLPFFKEKPASEFQTLAEEIQNHTQQENDVPNYIAWDLKHVWHPFTQHGIGHAPLLIKKAQGVWLELEDGQVILDGVSSWWVNIVGHGRPSIGRAIQTAQNELDHVIFAGATHPRAATLAHKLVELTAGSFDRAFFSDNGSTSVEVALKMAYQSWCLQGEPERREFLSLDGGYHGDTFGSMAVGKSSFHDVFKPLLFSVHSIDVDSDVRGLEPLLQKKTIAGLIVEPGIQGAGGMRVLDPEWLQQICNLCRSHNIPVILDEVLTGFGRVGESFAFQRFGLQADLICLSKGITGGTLPLGVTMCREELYQRFLSDDRKQAFLHGHSYTANSITCAAALAALEIFQAENLAKRAFVLEKAYQSWILERAAAGAKFHNPRCLGGILAFDLAPQGDYFQTTLHKTPEVVAKLALQHRLFLRPLGNTVYFMPPLVITDQDLHWALKQLTTFLQEVV